MSMLSQETLYLGIDIGGTAVKLGIVTARGEILETQTESVDFDHYQTPIIRTVLSSIDKFFAVSHLSPAMLKGIGVSATGQIDTKEGIVAGTAGHIANYLHTPIKKLLEDAYGLPVVVANDANCALMGEYWKGAAAGCEDVIMLTIGTGVGGGILTGGRLLAGHRGIAGELGHFPLKSDGIPCTCGLVGCYEQYASTTALVKKVRQAWTNSATETDPAGEIDGRLIFRQLAAGDSLIESMVASWISDIASGLAGLIHIFNPRLVLIGGGVSRQQELFIEPLKRAVFADTMPGFRQDLTLCPAALGNSAGLLGAVYCLINNDI